MPIPKSSKPSPSPKPARKFPAAKQAASPTPQPTAKRAKSQPRAKSAPNLLPEVALRPHSKQAQLLNLLGTSGATMVQMEELTGWQPHTIRATLSAVFRKRLNLNIEAGYLPHSKTRHYRLIAETAA